MSVSPTRLLIYCVQGQRPKPYLSQELLCLAPKDPYEMFGEDTWMQMQTFIPGDMEGMWGKKNNTDLSFRELILDTEHTHMKIYHI